MQSVVEPSKTIDHTTLTRLVEAGAVRGADVVGMPGGWGVVIKYGMLERPLAARRGQLRNFRRFEAVVSYLREMGICQYRVDASNFDSQALKTPRPDAAERLRSVFEAKRHADWVRERVATAKADERPNVSHDEVMTDARALLAAKRQQHAQA